MATAGFGFAVMHPRVWIGKIDPLTGRGPLWPSRTGSKLTTSTLPVNWKRWWGHQNGLQITIQDPQAAISSSDRGILGQVSTGAHGIAIASVSQTPILDFIKWFTKQATTTISATGGTAEVQTLALAGTTAGSAGNAVVVVDNEVYTVPIASADTPTLAATALRNPANYTPTLTGWTLSGATTNVIYTSTSPGNRTGQFSATLPTGLTGAFTETTPGVAPTFAGGETMFFDPNGEYGSVQRFTILVEGTAPAGSLADQALLIRFVAHQVNQGGNTPLRMDDSGNDANFRVNLAGQCEPRAVSALELLNTGFDGTQQDPYGKATWWIANLV